MTFYNIQINFATTFYLMYIMCKLNIHKLDTWTNINILQHKRYTYPIQPKDIEIKLIQI